MPAFISISWLDQEHNSIDKNSKLSLTKLNGTFPKVSLSLASQLHRREDSDSLLYPTASTQLFNFPCAHIPTIFIKILCLLTTQQSKCTQSMGFFLKKNAYKYSKQVIMQKSEIKHLSKLFLGFFSFLSPHLFSLFKYL